jgi:ABC-2 type transport system permease protein
MAAVMENLAKAQFVAVARMRRDSMMHSLKTMSGKLELISRIAVIGFYSLMGLGVGTGAGILAYFAVINRQAELIAAMIWFLFGFWQLFPILRAGYTNTFDASTLLRFPVAYRTYFLLRCFYSALEPVAIVAVLGLVGITAGVTTASPALLPWCAVIAALIIALNILTTQLALSWVERWLAQRRTREILGMLFFVFIVGMQLIGPLTRQMEHRQDEVTKSRVRITKETARKIIYAERALPPGLVGYGLAKAQKHEYAKASLAVGGLALYGFAMVLLLDLRLRKQYRGENLSESAARPRTEEDKTPRVGWNVAGISLPLAAMIEKEVRYLLRSGPMLLSFVMPLVVLLIFGGTGARQIPQRFSSMSFPLVAAYSLLILTNVVYNTFGGDHSGVQFYYLSPVPLRKVILGKNAVHAALFVLELGILWVAVRVLRTTPELWVTAATLAAVPFALGLEFSAGNILSILWPKKLEFQMMGRQRTPQVSALLALVVHAAVVATCALVFLAAGRYGGGVAVTAFLILDVSAVVLYFFLLTKAEELALKRRETMFEALCRE